VQIGKISESGEKAVETEKARSRRVGVLPPFLFFFFFRARETVRAVDVVG
jgi:hypothetical protein